MNQSYCTRRILAVAFAMSSILLPSVATAQVRSLDSTRNGNGTLSYDTRSNQNRVRRVRIYLNSNHRGDVHLLSGASGTFSGTWRASGLTKVYLTIDRVNGNEANGTGVVVHDNRGEFASVFCSGMVGGRKFDFRFDADTLIGGGNPGGGGREELNITRPRNGSTVSDSRVTIEGTSRAREVRVRVYDSDRHLVTDNNVRVRDGRWSTRVTVDRGGYRVNVNDDSSRRTDEISFRYGGDRDLDDKVFKDNAKDAIRDKFRGYDIDFDSLKVRREMLGNRTVRGDFKVKGRGDKKGDYRMYVICGGNTGKVTSVSYSRK